MSSLPSLHGRNVVVTGASGALGRVVARELLGRGAQLHLPLRAAADPGLFGGAAAARVRLVAGVDLADERAVSSFYADLPGLWASVHCAGGFAMAGIAETSLDDLQKLLSLNTLTAFLCSRAAVVALRRQGGGGRIVNVASRQALEPRRGAGMVAYSASKAALAGLTIALAEEVAAEGILVNAVAPSTLAPEPGPETRPADGGLPTCADVAALIATLVDPQQVAVQGAVLPVYGRGAR